MYVITKIQVVPHRGHYLYTLILSHAIVTLQLNFNDFCMDSRTF